jgi:suppressor for copper-sensitivity B
LALLGGLILNLMPCVLPVLSIKLLSVVSHGGRGRRSIRVSFLASAAGILFSFLVLAAGALALKAAGLAVGWGIQYQQPAFLSAMALLVTLFACNLLGWFEIPLPAWLGGLAGPGGSSGGGGHSLGGHFATGAFATLLATPCSAPFLGTAVGFALARGPLEILLIFGMLGLGLALPYLAVAAFPGLAGRLPRPGPWMVVLRRILGLALAGTAVWLLTVLAAQVGATGALLAGGLLLGVGLLFFLGGRLRGPVLAASVSALALAAVALPVGIGATARPEPAPAAAATGDWRPLDPAEIGRLVAAGKVVFVDVTADWCITCQVNKKLVLERDEVAERLDSKAVVTMRGDWTLPSDEITAYLTGYGRYGIPFNAVFGPGAPDGTLLPELLTVETVLDALDAAAGG